MSWNSKVVWSEGMFMRPQHFQQQDRHIGALVRGLSRHHRPYDWGALDVALDREALALGRISVSRCRGVLPDGTPVNIPDDDIAPPPLEIGDDIRDVKISLGLPLSRAGMAEAERQPDGKSVIRFGIEEEEVRDNNVGAISLAPVEIARRRFRLLHNFDEIDEFATIGLCRVIEKRSDNTVMLDESYIPPTLDCRVNPLLSGFLNEIIGLLKQRGDALAARVSASGRGGVAEISDFLLLQVVNRFEPLFAHLARMSNLHPEDFYQAGLQVAGELSTFTSASKRPAQFPVYLQDDLKATFEPLMLELRQALSMVLEQNAIQIPLQDRNYGVRVGIVPDKDLLKTASFVLSIKADMPSEQIRSRFPSQVKIGPVEHIRQLVNLQLPGIGLHALPVAPRQIPYHAGLTYFELDRSGEFWEQLHTSGGFALHVSGQFPGVELALWAIKG